MSYLFRAIAVLAALVGGPFLDLDFQSIVFEPSRCLQCLLGSPFSALDFSEYRFRDVAPFDFSPKTKTSSMPDFFAAGNARSKNSGTVNKNLEPLSFNWCKRSCSE